MRFIIKILLLLVPVLGFSRDDQQENKLGTTIDSIITPSLNKAWTVEEFQDILNSIVGGGQNHSSELITLAKNEKLFDKLTNIGNYWFFDSSYYSLNDRFKFSQAILPRVNKVFMMYYQRSRSVNGKLSFESEIAAFFDVLLGLVKMQALLAEEFIRGEPNPTTIQLEGHNKLIQGAVTMESGALITIGKEYHFFSEASICRISRSFSNFYSFMYSRIDAESKTEFDGKIAELIKTHPYTCVREALQSR